jgi:hypothetical protein
MYSNIETTEGGNIIRSFPKRKNSRQISTLTIKAIIWFSVSDETNTPIPIKKALISTNPTKLVTKGQNGIGPIILIVIKYRRAGAIVITISDKAERYFPSISSISDTGFVSSSSSVPCFFSSEKLLIVIAGIKTTNNIICMKKFPKKSLIEATLAWKKFIENKNPDININTIITIYAIGELK